VTIAICVRCGAQKPGAFTPCARCSYDPATDPDRRNQARALWLSDHHLKPEALRAIGVQLEAGQPVAYDDRVLDELVVQLQTQQNALLVGKTKVGCSIFVWSLMAIVAVGVAAVIFLVTYRE
jgi:hypothetical protein